MADSPPSSAANTSDDLESTMNLQEALTWIAEVFEEPAGRLTPETERKAIPGWDSLGTLSLIAALDEKFDIQISEQEIEAMRSVDDVFSVLRREGKL
jgi:acyl carrier protein